MSTKKTNAKRKGSSNASFRPKKAKTPKERTFTAEFIVVVKIKQSLLDAVLTDEWRKHYYNLRTPEDVAGHLAFNFMQNTPLNLLDGFADQPEDAAVMVGRPEFVDCNEDLIK